MTKDPIQTLPMYHLEPKDSFDRAPRYSITQWICLYSINLCEQYPQLFIILTFFITVWHWMRFVFTFVLLSSSFPTSSNYRRKGITNYFLPFVRGMEISFYWEELIGFTFFETWRVFSKKKKKIENKAKAIT